MLITTLTPASKTQVISKPSDQGVTSSTVLVNDTALQFQGLAGCVYNVTWTLQGVWGATGGINVGVLTPAGATQLIQAIADATAIVPAQGVTTASNTAISLLPATSTGGTVTISALITVVNSGLISLQWAQSSSSGTTTTVKANSNMVVVQQ